MLVTSKNEPTVSGLQPWSLKHFSALCQNASRPWSISHSIEFLAFSNSASTWILESTKVHILQSMGHYIEETVLKGSLALDIAKTKRQKMK